MKSAILETIGAFVVTIVILGIPVLSFASFVYDWPSFIVMSLLTGLLVDFLYVVDRLIE